jgi:hypothetical protein
MKRAVVAGASMISAVVLAGPAQEKAWKAVMEESTKKASENASVKANCGHPIKVKADWTGFPFDKFAGKPEGPRWCSSSEIIDAVSYDCDASGAENVGYKEGAKKITKLTCHYKACEKLPSSFRPELPRKPDDKNPGTQYKLSADGHKLEMWDCEDSSVFGDRDGRWALRQLL